MSFLADNDSGRGRDVRLAVGHRDSTGLAIQDLAVSIAVYERWRTDPRGQTFAGITELEVG
jgi:ornithine cyclodeaminase/alanine dehydrogenase-like protein (mu-crystallin family)